MHFVSFGSWNKIIKQLTIDYAIHLIVSPSPGVLKVLRAEPQGSAREGQGLREPFYFSFIKILTRQIL